MFRCPLRASPESAFLKCWLSPSLVCNGDRAPCVELLCVGNHYEMPGRRLDDIRVVSPSAILSYQTGLAGSLSLSPSLLSIWKALNCKEVEPELPLSWQPHPGLPSPSKGLAFQWKAPGVHPHLSPPESLHPQIVRERSSLGSMTDLRLAI